jgi:TolB-like protein/DNA-binding winged helix-turn-helix (wHTH) protein
MGAIGTGRVLHFEDFALDLERGMLLRAGSEIALRPQSFEVLRYLAGHPRRLISKDELLKAVWAGRVVTDDSINQCVTEIRAALDDRDRVKIKTIPRRGLLFQLPVSEAASNSTAAPSGGHWRRRGALLAVVLAVALVALLIYRTAPNERPAVAAPETPASGADPPQTLAVLPFVDMTPARDQGHMADGLTEELIMELSQVEGLRVAGRTSSFMFKDRQQDLRAIGEALGVEHVLGGSVRRSGEQWRITAELVVVDGGFSLWSNTYERPIQDFFAIQDEIALSVTSALMITLGLGGRNYAYATTSIEAYEQVMLARSKMWREPGIEIEVMEHLRRAVELDPEYAYAWGSLAVSYSYLQEGASPNWRQDAEAMLERAQQLKPQSTELLFTAAQLYLLWGDFMESEATLRQAEASADPPMSMTRLDLSIKVDKSRKAIGLSKRAIAREPLWPLARMYRGQALVSAGRVDDALQQWEELIGPEWGQNAFFNLGLTTAMASGSREAVARWLNQSLEVADNEVNRAMAERLDDPAAARQWLRELPVDSGGAWEAQHWAAYLGDTERALDLMEAYPDPWSMWMPHFATVRSTSRFKRLIETLGLVDYWRTYGWGDHCQPVGETDFECH